MIKITFITEQYNIIDLVNEIDHTARLIEQGYTEGNGWKIEGKAEKEPAVIQTEEEDEEVEMSEDDKEAKDLLGY